MRREAQPAPGADAGDRRDPAALLAVLRALLVLQVVSAALPGMWTWGQNLPRFVPPWLGIGAMLALVASALPTVVNASGRLPGAAGDFVRRNPVTAAIAWGLVLAVLVLALPDRTRLVGDSQLREGIIRQSADAAALFPQAFPLDLALHVRLPRALAASAGIDPLVTHRAIGAVEAGVLGAATVAFAAAFGVGGTACAATIVAASGGGVLALLTGYPKAFAELAMFGWVFAAAGAWIVRRGRGLAVAGLAITGAVLAHRSAALWLPAWTLLLAHAWRQTRGRESAQGAVAIVGAVPFAVLAWLSPLAASAWTAIDRGHLLAGGAGVLGAVTAALAPLRLLDAVQAALWFAPLAPVLVLAPLVRDSEDRATMRFLLWFALPLAILFVAVVPRQGTPRDWDVFTASGVALAAAAAGLCAALVPRSRAGAAVAMLVVALAWIPAVLALASAADPASGLRRAVALAEGPPTRPDGERGLTWTWIAITRHLQGDHRASLEAYGRAATLVPSPRTLELLAGEAVELEDWATATATYRQMAERAPDFAAWLAMARTAHEGRDWASVRFATARALAMEPADAEARELAAMARDSLAAIPSERRR